jgi:hypothetical protein
MESRAWLALAAAHAEGISRLIHAGARGGRRCVRWQRCVRVRLRAYAWRHTLAVQCIVIRLGLLTRSALDAVPALAPPAAVNAATVEPSPQALCKRLAGRAAAQPDGRTCIAEALAASSTVRALAHRSGQLRVLTDTSRAHTRQDQEEAEDLSNTLSKSRRAMAWNQLCYWSSAGSARADAEDHVTYRRVLRVHARSTTGALTAPCCIAG